MYPQEERFEEAIKDRARVRLALAKADTHGRSGLAAAHDHSRETTARARALDMSPNQSVGDASPLQPVDITRLPSRTRYIASHPRSTRTSHPRYATQNDHAQMIRHAGN